MHIPARMRFVAVAVATTIAFVGFGAPAFANTRAQAYKVGTGHRVGHDWRMSLQSRRLDANAVVANTNEFNDRPRRGFQYVMVTVRGTKLTRGKGNLYWDLDFQLFGAASKHLYSQAFEVIPRDLSDQDDVLKGGQVSGNLLFEVSKRDVRRGGLVLRSDSFLENPVGWFRLH